MMAPIRDGMPVTLGYEDWGKWLGEEPATDNELKAMLKPFPNERMSVWPIGKAVGNVKNDAPELIERPLEQNCYSVALTSSNYFDVGVTITPRLLPAEPIGVNPVCLFLFESVGMGTQLDVALLPDTPLPAPKA
jgi:hypothetical protein